MTVIINQRKKSPLNAFRFWNAKYKAPAFGVNESIAKIDSMMQISVQSVLLTAPAGGETQNQMWYVAASATGAWAGQSGKLAKYVNGGWIFYTMPLGSLVYNIDDLSIYVWDGAALQFPELAPSV